MIKEIRVVLESTGLLDRPGDVIKITREDIEGYRRVEAALSFWDDALRPLRKKEVEE